MQLLNSATIEAPAGLIETGGGWRRVRIPVRFGQIEHAGQTVLVDTGYGPRVTSGQRSPALRIYNAILRPRLVPDAGPAKAPDVIFLTHFHADHVARLLDFPHAKILAPEAAVHAVLAMSPHEGWRHGIFKELLPDDFAARVTFIESLPARPTGTILGDGFDLFGDGTYLAVPLPGHALGHAGVYWRDANGPALHATDTAWTLRALLQNKTPGFARKIVFDDPRQGRETERLVRTFAAGGGRVLLCHDPEQTDA